MGLKSEAEDLALALLSGLDSVATAVAWADAQLATLEQPPHALIEISLAQNLPALDVVQLLRAVPGVADEPSAVRRLIARLTRALDEAHPDAHHIRDVLDALGREGLIDRAVAQEISNYGTRCELADAGYIPWEEATLDLRALLELCVKEE